MSNILWDMLVTSDVNDGQQQGQAVTGSSPRRG